MYAKMICACFFMTGLELRVKKFLVDRGWGQLRPGDVAKSITIEAAELLKHFNWENPTLEEYKKDRVKVEELAPELADVLICALELAVLLNLDASRIVRAKLALQSKKYPAALMRKTRNDTDGAGALYYKIRKAHRRKNLVRPSKQ